MPPPVATAVVRRLERENEREEVATEWIRKIGYNKRNKVEMNL
jgi:hypothetical protein